LREDGLEISVRKAQFANEKLQRFIFASKPRPYRNLVKGVLFEISAWLLIPIVCISCAALLNLTAGFVIGILPQLYLIVGLILFVISLLKLSFFARSIRRRARRYRLDNRRRLSWDKRPPILYLRSFYDDYQDYIFQSDRKSPEETLTFALEDAGPIITVGRPNERLPLLGAARIYLKDDWQGSVKYLMTISQLVIIHADVSEGLLWEINAAKELVPPERLLISFLAWEKQDKATRKKLYASFRRRSVSFKECLPQSNDALFLLFDSAWNPIPVKLRTSAKLIFFGRGTDSIRETLRPHLKKRGMNIGLRKNVVYAVNILVTTYFIYQVVLTVKQFPFGSLIQFVIPVTLFPLWFLYVVIPVNLVLKAASYLIHRVWLRYKPVTGIV
jgi:hypothetical protein